jgi:hypothetical protein
LTAGKGWEPDEESPFGITCYSDSEKVKLIRCLLCKETIFDDAKDGKDMEGDALTKVAVLHLSLRHGDQYQIRR